MRRGAFMPSSIYSSVAQEQYNRSAESAAIAARLSSNDPSVVDELVHRYGSRLRGYLISLTENRETAEDLLQETWVRVVTRGSQFKGESQFVTWLFAIARNLVADRRRRRKGLTTSLDEMQEAGDLWQLPLADLGKNPFDQCAAAEHAGQVVDALRSLQPEHRRLLEMRFYQEMSLIEIAKKIKAPLPTVKSRVYRSLLLLRRRLEQTCLTKADKACAA
jgi:RNA polymerase sigma-70 factor, ECF subfamily